MLHDICHTKFSGKGKKVRVATYETDFFFPEIFLIQAFQTSCYVNLCLGMTPRNLKGEIFQCLTSGKPVSLLLYTVSVLPTPPKDCTRSS